MSVSRSAVVALFYVSMGYLDKDEYFKNDQKFKIISNYYIDLCMFNIPMGLPTSTSREGKCYRKNKSC